MKVGDYESWAKDGHGFIQMSAKQFSADNGIVKLHWKNLRQLLCMATGRKGVAPKDLLAAAMNLTVKRLDLMMALEEALGISLNELKGLLDELAIASDVPEAAVCELFLEVSDE